NSSGSRTSTKCQPSRSGARSRRSASSGVITSTCRSASPTKSESARGGRTEDTIAGDYTVAKRADSEVAWRQEASSAMQVGESAEAGFTVQHSDTAEVIAISPEDSFPPVFSTSRMIALMELAAARAMRPMLEPGQLSVGVALAIEHRAPTPVGGH